ncbi:cytochrome P450 [Mycena albidolilacea]|uniref:Cytochrome P450 n=1 Tax=Mycena albidolilacea TaxID=1033008 RepID=A0AAD7A043_9AGAR|nr:cytochrome P450 [Mycena albidolilacea]
MHLNVAGMSIIVLSSMEVIRDLLNRCSSIYSDRIHAPQRRRREMFHKTFHSKAVKQFNPHMRDSTHRLLHRMLKEPHDLMDHFMHLTGALIMDVTNRINVRDSDDPYIKIVEEAMHGMSVACVLGTFLVDSIPALEYVPSWFPGADFKRKACQWQQVARELQEVPFAETKRNIEKDVKETAGASYAAGADTTVLAMGTFALAMLKYPEAQAKAQVELDTVIGHGSLPEWGDPPALLYVTALVKEVFRWQNVAPNWSAPHATSRGQVLRVQDPSELHVVGNVWYTVHLLDQSDDSLIQEIYPDPTSFKPEWFLLNGKLNPDIRDPEAIVFGFGRRWEIFIEPMCPGQHLALSSVWLKIASILATFVLKKAVNKKMGT